MLHIYSEGRLICKKFQMCTKITTNSSSNRIIGHSSHGFFREILLKLYMHGLRHVFHQLFCLFWYNGCELSGYCLAPTKCRSFLVELHWILHWFAALNNFTHFSYINRSRDDVYWRYRYKVFSIIRAIGGEEWRMTMLGVWAYAIRHGVGLNNGTRIDIESYS